jgi:hypothetical protein
MPTVLASLYCNAQGGVEASQSVFNLGKETFPLRLLGRIQATTPMPDGALKRWRREGLKR